MMDSNTITGNKLSPAGNAQRNIQVVLIYFIAAVWLVNGLFCKVFDLVPRHELIVSRILGNDHSRMLTFLIGLAETVMAIWIVSRLKHRLSAIVQIAAVAIMNTIEFILAPDLLLWGKFNSLFALLFIALIYFSEFHLNKKVIQPN